MITIDNRNVIIIATCAAQMAGAVAMVCCHGDAEKAVEMTDRYRSPDSFIDGVCTDRDLAKFLRAIMVDAIADIDASGLLK